MAGLTYSGYVTQIATMAVVEEANTAFQTIIPSMLDYAELRLLRDLDLLETSQAFTGYTIASGSRTFTVPEGTIVVCEQLNVITPSGTSNPNSGTRNPLFPVTKEFLDAVYGSSSTRGVPRYFAPFNDNIFLVGPYSDANYTIELVGTIRPETLSSTNPETFLSKYFPDLLIMASMIYISAYQRNFGRQSDDPQMAQSYEAQYQVLLKGATVEEARKKFESSAWSSQSPAVVASPTR